MDSKVDYSELVRQAQLGDHESMRVLAQLSQRRLSVYIYRLTLNHDVTQDLVQETMLELVRSLKNLRDAERFWPWLFRTALGKVQHHYRDKRTESMVQMSAL